MLCKSGNYADVYTYALGRAFLPDVSSAGTLSAPGRNIANVAAQIQDAEQESAKLACEEPQQVTFNPKERNTAKYAENSDNQVEGVDKERKGRLPDSIYNAYERCVRVQKRTHPGKGYDIVPGAAAVEKMHANPLSAD